MSRSKGLSNGDIPKLVRGCRLGKDGALLMPEGIIKLSSSAMRILELCDGKRTVDQIIAALEEEFSAGASIRKDVLSFLNKLVEKRAVETSKKGKS